MSGPQPYSGAGRPGERDEGRILRLACVKTAARIYVLMLEQGLST